MIATEVIFSKTSLGKPVRFLQTASTVMAIWSVVALGIHLWPFEGKHTLEMCSPLNVGILLWTILAMIAMLCRTTRQLIVARLPDRSIWAFLAIAAASVGFSPHLGQSATSLAKLVLMYVGAFTLFRWACSRPGWAARLCMAAMAAACLAMISFTIGLGGKEVGLFANPYKYGTVVAILFTLGSAYLASQRSRLAWLIVPAAVLAVISTVTLGGLLGIVAGFVAGVAVSKQPRTRWRLAVGLGVIVITLAASWPSPALAKLRDDVQLGEPNGTDLRQRYIEWQANLNLLEKRPVTGTGLGCVNEYRSMFYGSLPKLNSLQPFDRNGWLLIAAETGILGLAAWVWIIATAGRFVWHAVRQAGPGTDLATAALAGLVSACAAHTFSSVNYNGVLNAFVLVLALAHHAAARKDSLIDPCPQGVTET